MMDNYNKLRLAGPCLYYASFTLVVDNYWMRVPFDESELELSVEGHVDNWLIPGCFFGVFSRKDTTSLLERAGP